MKTSFAINPLVGIGIIMGALLASMVLVRLFQKKVDSAAEYHRKAVHALMGLIVLWLPWLFPDKWPVMVLGVLSLVFLIAVKKVPFLKANLGPVLHGVARKSYGEYYFVIAVVALYVLSGDQPIFFSIPILLLALADTVAAIIGMNYGRLRFETSNGFKSMEGSAAFFTVAFLSIHVPLLLLTPTGRAECLLIALIGGLLVMLLEAVSWNGLDNLLIPLGGYLMLLANLQLSTSELALKLGVLVGLGALLLLLRRNASLNTSGLFSSTLLGYSIWTLGGLLWLVPGLVMFISYMALWPRTDHSSERPHDIRAVMTTVAPGLLWLSFSRIHAREDFLLPFTVTFAIAMTFNGISWFRAIEKRLSGVTVVGKSALKAGLTFMIPYVLAEGLSMRTFGHVSAMLLICFLAGVAYASLIPHREDYDNDNFPWHTQAAINFGLSLLCLLILPDMPFLSDMLG